MTKKMARHDSFFKSSMNEPRVARAFFDKYLPETLRSRVDLEALQIEKENYVDERLKKGIVDILFSVPIDGRPGYIYLLVEHQSTSDRWMPFRLRHYVSLILHDLITTSNPEFLPLVYPMVFYNGKDAWQPTRDFLSLFDAPRETADRCLNQPFHLIDLSEVDDEHLKGELWLHVVLVLMKHIHDDDIRETLLDLMPYLLQIEQETNGVAFLIRAIHYLISSCKARNVEEVVEITVETFSQKTGEGIVTYAEELIDRGRLEMKGEMQKQLNMLREQMQGQVDRLKQQMVQVKETAQQRQKRAEIERQQAEAERQQAEAEARRNAEELLQAKRAHENAMEDVAVKMLQNGCEPELISKTTGLSPEQIADLRSDCG